jgi:AcrR family transcriptional regulator
MMVDRRRWGAPHGDNSMNTHVHKRSLPVDVIVVKISVNGYVLRMEKRGYRLGERAKQREATRQRIIEAVARLHAEIGPAATTISGIAERAGVQRLTVYRHFPDEAGLFEACAAHSDAQHPAPEPTLWEGIADPLRRTETMLAAVYGYYEPDAEGLALVLRDAERLPALADTLAPMREYLRMLESDLARAWAPSAGDAPEFDATVGLALEFWSWRTLAARGLGPVEAARLMARLVAAAAEGPGVGHPPAAEASTPAADPSSRAATAPSPRGR